MKKRAPTRSQQKWTAECRAEQNDINWNTSYMSAYNCTKSTKLREFQFKLLHRRIQTSDFLARIVIKESPICSFCNEDPESLHHLLWSCSKTKLFWDRLLLTLKNHQIVPENYVLETAVAIGLKSDSAKSTCQLDFCFLIARYYIWLYKTKESVLELNGLLDFFKLMCVIQETTETDGNALSSTDVRYIYL